jgi:glycosyltransferase involved in cell wall biosynthesis
LRIAQIAPLYESVPPQGYGGTERVVSYLTGELVRQGHEVTLFASGDSATSARLVPICPRSLRLDPGCVDPLAHHVRMLEAVYRRAAEFDVLHFHVDYLHFPWSRRHRAPHLTTLHGRLDIPDLVPLYREYREMPVVSISDAQRAPLPWLRWLGTVHHGLPRDLLAAGTEPGDHLLFVGRTSPEKGLDAAIEIARRAGLPLKIAAKVDRADRAYFEEVIRPLLGQPHVEFLGEVGEQEKGPLLRGARALLFPVDWPEPFGLVMIEALACGTPVVAFRRGSVPEILADPRAGFLCDGVEEAAAAVARAGDLDRRGCREVFEERFTATRMAREYLRLYAATIKGAGHGADGPGAGAVLHPGDRAPGR